MFGTTEISRGRQVGPLMSRHQIQFFGSSERAPSSYFGLHWLQIAEDVPHKLMANAMANHSFEPTPFGAAQFKR